MTATAIDPGRSRSLARWNRALTLLHGIQAVIMVAVGTTDARFAPYITTAKPIFENGTFAGLEEVQLALFDIPLAWFIASFFVMSAIAHATAGWFLRSRYEGWLARGMNPLRWVEYAFSSTVMILAISSLSFINEFSALIAIAGCNVAMNLFGWSMEAANEGRLAKGEKVDWKHYIFGCIAGIIPWIAILGLVVAYTVQPDLPEEAQIPAFVYAIIASLFLAFNIFAITMVLQYKQVGRWKDYLAGEKTYMAMSLIAKTLLAWQVFTGTLRPGG